MLCFFVLTKPEQNIYSIELYTINVYFSIKYHTFDISTSIIL